MKTDPDGRPDLNAPIPSWDGIKRRAARCSKCTQQRTAESAKLGYNLRLTGQHKYAPSHHASSGKFDVYWQYAVQCEDCGHFGWTRRMDIARRWAKEFGAGEKPAPPGRKDSPKPSAAPWRVRRLRGCDDNTRPLFVIESEQDGRVAEVVPSASAFANATLLASAPELLARLEQLLYFVDDAGDFVTKPRLRELTGQLRAHVARLREKV